MASPSPRTTSTRRPPSRRSSRCRARRGVLFGVPDSPALAISGLKFRYPSAPEGAWTVDIASLALARGEQMLLTAGSGLGKSTLLQLIAGLLDPAEGRVEVDGQGVHALHGARR